MFRFIIAILLGVLCIIFFAQNTVPASVVFLFWTLSVPTGLLLFIVLVIGILLGWVICGKGRKKKKA
ncbi:MAG: LapA family protein [Spirochaetales bacterium]|nr:LapA family protein [Spirochaetales bacterium]